jgi:bifunctional ADP-heptose synthase (sugar kinase/adenylyltransferase)
LTELQNTQQQTKFKVLLVGDSCRDEYYYGTVERISPEAPVPIVRINRCISKMGMAVNVKENLETLGCRVDFITGDQISIKRRYLDIHSKQHMLRVDDDRESSPLDPQLAPELLCSDYHAVVISDYNKGLITYDFIKKIRDGFSGPIFLDTKKPDLAQFQGCYVKVNQTELAASTSQCSDLIVTLGERGARYQDITYAAPMVHVADVCGAGDSFLAALTVRYLQTKSMASAIDFANRCAAITVQHHGVYALTLDDIKNLTFNL